MKTTSDLTTREIVTSWRLVGSCYRNGHRSPGFGLVETSHGKTVYVPEDKARGIEGLLAYAEAQGVNADDARGRVTDWAKTGEGVRFALSR